MEELQTVSRTLHLLRHFAANPRQRFSLADLATSTGINKATLLRMLETLVSHDFLVRDPETKRYRLGLAALELGNAAAAGLEVRRVAYSYMRTLTQATGETTLLHMVTLPDVICIEKVESPNPVRVAYDINRRGPLYAGSSGKVLLAFMDEAERLQTVERLELHRFTDLTITDKQRLHEELAAIRRQGYATSLGELDPGVVAVAAPVWNHMGKLEAGLTLVGPGHRWTADRWPEWIRATCEAAVRISQALGYVDASSTTLLSGRGPVA